MQPNNVIIGDEDTGINLPQAQPDERDLAEEKKMAKYSKTAEFKRIQDHFKERTEFYQKYLPDGRPIATIAGQDLEIYWKVANLVIAEFDGVINLFENAQKVVDDERLQSS